MNPFEQACIEFLKGCSNMSPDRPQDCSQCLDAFVEHIQKIKGEKYYACGALSFWLKDTDENTEE